jgi:hypothetical protein
LFDQNVLIECCSFIVLAQDVKTDATFRLILRVRAATRKLTQHIIWKLLSWSVAAVCKLHLTLLHVTLVLPSGNALDVEDLQLRNVVRSI